MKRMPFTAPDEHYDERIEAIDEELCNLLNQRKELSNNNPGFPTKDFITAWSKKYNLYEDLLNSIFSSLLYEDIYKPVVEPEQFIKNIPVLKSFEKDGVFYTVTFIRQFNNASVVHFTIDKDNSNDDIHERFHNHSYFELSIEGNNEDYNCRNDRGGGSGAHFSYSFIVSPALPDDITTIKFTFLEQQSPHGKPTGLKFVI